MNLFRIMIDDEVNNENFLDTLRDFESNTDHEHHSIIHAIFNDSEYIASESQAQSFRELCEKIDGFKTGVSFAPEQILFLETTAEDMSREAFCVIYEDYKKLETGGCSTLCYNLDENEFFVKFEASNNWSFEHDCCYKLFELGKKEFYELYEDNKEDYEDYLEFLKNVDNDYIVDENYLRHEMQELIDQINHDRNVKIYEKLAGLDY